MYFVTIRSVAPPRLRQLRRTLPLSLRPETVPRTSARLPRASRSVTEKLRAERPGVVERPDLRVCVVELNIPVVAPREPLTR